MKKYKDKKRRKWPVVIILCVTCLLLYEIIGALAPFTSYKSTSPSQLKPTSEFYSDSVCDERAGILETSSQALEARINLIESAKESIVLSTFDMRQGSSSTDLAAVLLRAADRGVDVKILVDGLSGLLRMEGKDFFLALARHPSIEIKLYNKPDVLRPWTFNGRMHDKYLIVDNERYILGGRNTFDYFLGDYIENNKSYDREIIVYSTNAPSSSASQLSEYFETVWNLDVSKSFHNDKDNSSNSKINAVTEKIKSHYDDMKNAFPKAFDITKSVVEIYPTDKITILFGETSIYSKEPVVFDTLAALMSEADSCVSIHTPYAVLNEHMYSALREISENVGDFRLYLNSTGNGDNIVASSDYTKNKQKIIDTGVSLYEFNGEYSTHSKTIVIDDDISVIGSYNLDLRSTYMDTEIMAVIDSKEFNNALREYLDFFESASIKCIDKNNYEYIPEYTIKEPKGAKRAVIDILSILLVPFRYVI